MGWNTYFIYWSNKKTVWYVAPKDLVDNHNCINCASGYYKISGTNNCYDDSIKEAITTLYKTKKSKRYDVFNEMKKNPKKNSSTTQTDNNNIIIWNLAFLFVATVIVMSYIGIKFKELNNKIDSLNPVKTEINKIKENIKTKEDNKKVKKDTKKGK